MQAGFKRNKLFKTIFISILLILLFSLISVFSSCSLAAKLFPGSKTNPSESSNQDSVSPKTSPDMEESMTTKGGDDKPFDSPEKEENEPGDRQNPGKVVYLEITSAPESNHFEHRVANIFAKDITTGEEELIFSDINERFEIGRVFDISPDGKKILCDLVEGGRGAYSAICVIDVNSKTMKVLEEFDFTENEENEVTSGYYGRPVWSSDSSYIAYEILYNYLSSNIRDGGIYKVNVETGEKKEIGLDVGGVSLRSTMFLSPVFFFNDDNNIACVSHFYFQNSLEADSLLLETKNAEIFYISEDKKQAEFKFDLSAFSGEGPENVTSFDNFKYIKGIDSYVFQVLGDFEEDGDLWIADTKDTDIRRLTSDESLREQNPDVFMAEGDYIRVAYVGAKRYGTISNQFGSGDIYISDLEGEKIDKITSYGTGAFNPVFSRDGKYIAFMKAVYDENYENILRYDIEAVNINTKEIIEISDKGYLVLAGWIN